MKKDKGLVKVKILDESLKKHSGLFMHTGIKKALDGEKRGLWVIISELDDIEAYENKELATKDYKTKIVFK